MKDYILFVTVAMKDRDLYKGENHTTDHDELRYSEETKVPSKKRKKSY